METTQMPDEPAPGEDFAARVEAEPRRMVEVEMLTRMSLEELLYYVLVGDGRRVSAEQG
jgi:hypothetical protein